MHSFKRLQKARNDDAGFTLIELLIVIVVLGILAAVVVFALGGVTSQSAASSCNSDAKSVETAIAAYNAQNSSSPIAATGASGASQQTVQGAMQAVALSDLVPTYLHSWPSNYSHYALAANGTWNSTTLTFTSNGDVSVYANPASTVTSPATAVASAGYPGVSYDSQTSTTGCNGVK